MTLGKVIEIFSLLSNCFYMPSRCLQSIQLLLLVTISVQIKTSVSVPTGLYGIHSQSRPKCGKAANIEVRREIDFLEIQALSLPVFCFAFTVVFYRLLCVSDLIQSVRDNGQLTKILNRVGTTICRLALQEWSLR